MCAVASASWCHDPLVPFTADRLGRVPSHCHVMPLPTVHIPSAGMIRHSSVTRCAAEACSINSVHNGHTIT